MRNRKERIVKALVLATGVFTLLSAHSAPLWLKSGKIDVGVRASSASLKAASSSVGTATTTKFIVQHEGKIPSDWRRSIEAAGAKVLRYVPENAYLISASEDVQNYIRTNIAHSAFLPYAKQYRLDPQIQATAPALSSASAEDVETNVAIYAVSLFSAEVRDDYVRKINALTGCRVLKADGAVIEAELTDEGVQAVSEMDEVEYISPWSEPKLNNNIAVQAARMNVTTVWPGGESNLGLTGSGQVVGIADTGLDTGNTNTVHADVRGRILRTYALARTNDWSDLNGHGTHVTGSVLGNGANSGDLKIRGTAYEASLVFQSVANKSGSLTGIPNDLNELFSQAYGDENGKKGARIHSNSWGGSGATYSASSRAIDQFSFAHPDMLVLFAASNDGTDTKPADGVIDEGSLSDQATAKNCLSVGASENYRTSGGYSTTKWGTGWPTDYAVDPIKSDYVSRPADGVNQGLAAFSSRGPCSDGRIKPDIVAPGTDILSMRSSVGTSTMWGTYNSYYCYSGGTSMATPLVAGAAAVVRQWLVEHKGLSNPDGATIKALLAAGAKSLSPGQYGADSHREIPSTYPNNAEGWGQVNLGATLSNGGDLTVYDAQVIQDEEVQTFSFKVDSAGGRLVFVMAYADAPAALSASKQLVNDLDLKVVSPSGKVYYPNSCQSADRLNNMEGIRIAQAEAGVYTVTVTGYDVNTGMDTSLTGGKANAIRYSLAINAIANSSPLSSVSIAGSSSLGSAQKATYTCTAVYSNGMVQVVSPSWSVVSGSAYASISAAGVLTANTVTSSQSVTIRASYTEGDVTKTAEKTITVTRPLTLGDALDNATLTFTTGGSASWFPQTTNTHDGVDALQSGAIGNNQTNWLSTTISGPGTISFWWYASCEGRTYDYLSFSVDGVQTNKIGGTSCAWTKCSYVLPSGSHTLKWTYQKDYSKSKGLDAGFLDQVVWTPQYAVTYAPGSYGTGSAQTVMKTHGTALTLKGAIFTRSGYTQTGWATSNGGAQAYALGGTYTANAAITLYPVWTPVIDIGTALDNTNLTFTTDGSASWFAQTVYAHDGVDALRSGAISGSQVTWVQTTVTGPGTISFWWYASCEGGSCDYLHFSIDGVQTNKIGGTSCAWTQCSYVLPSGSHTLKWTYRKDGSADSGLDAGFLDQVVWTPQYAVIYAPGSYGTGSAQTVMKTHGTALTLKGATFTRSGYAQTGWATSDGGAKVYALGGTYTANAAITLYPVWTKVIDIGTALDNTALTFTTGGPTAWFGQTDHTHDGVDAMQSGAIGNNQTNWLSTTISGPGTISFWWYVSSETGWDFLEFLVDGSVVKSISGLTNAWTQITYQIATAESHSLQWRYRKDSSSGYGLDAGFVDQIGWMSAGNEPIPALPENATEADVAEALAEVADAGLGKNIKTPEKYNDFRDWAGKVKVTGSGTVAGLQTVQDSPYAWLSYALAADALIASLPTSDEITVETFEPTATAGTFDFTVSVEGVSVGAGAETENLAKVLGVEGGSVPDDLSSEAVSITFDTPADGKVRFTAGPKDTTAETFFMRVKLTP